MKNTICIAFLSLVLNVQTTFVETAVADDAARVVMWTINASGYGTTLEKASEVHNATLSGIREKQSQLGVADEEIILGLPELERVYYRWTPRGYRFHQTIYLRQRDTSQFEEFFETLAPLDSKAIRISFAYRPATWEPNVEVSATIANWNVIIIGTGKTLLESKQSHDRHLESLREILEDYGVGEIRTGNPYMVTVPENVNRDEKPEGYTYHQKITFLQTDMEKFESLLQKCTEIDSQHLNVEFTLRTE